MPTPPTPIQHRPGIPSQNNKARRKNKKEYKKVKKQSKYPYLQMT
jgi:hypothetical protein